MKRFVIVPVLGLTVLAVAASAQAQTAVWRDSRTAYSDGERQSYNDSRRAAYENGYREGLKLGERDSRRGRAVSYQSERTYQRADKGYHRSHGDIDRYRQVFRSGYTAGYNDAFRRNNRPGYGNGRVQSGDPRWSTGYPGGYGGGYGAGRVYNPAFQNGLDDGYEKGREDIDKRRSFDVLRHKWYREGDRNFEGRYGSREQYKDIYRQGFKEGYDRGYREGRYR